MSNDLTGDAGGRRVARGLVIGSFLSLAMWSVMVALVLLVATFA